MGASIEMLIRAIAREEVDARMRQELPRLPPAPPPRAAAIEATYVTRKQASEITGYCRRTIDRLVADGKLPGYGPRLDRIKLSELHRMMADTRKREPVTHGDAEAEIKAEVARLLGRE